MAVEAPLIQEQLITQNGHIAERVGYSPEATAENYQAWSVPLRDIEIDGHPEPITAERFHVGPDGLTGAGGMKAKAYPTPEDTKADGFAHAAGMETKIAVIDETEYAGHKSIMNVDPRKLDAEIDDGLRQLLRGKADGMFEAGLHLPERDKPAGDEGTNKHIVSYIERLEELGMPYAYAAATGKPDMGARAAATGEGAAIVTRTIMRRNGLYVATAALQGVGFAGGYFASEAYRPELDEDAERRILLEAVGDLGPNGRPATLVSEDAEGLPITKEMVDAILLNREHDLDVEAAKGNSLIALASKLAREGARFRYVEEDVLTYGGTTYIVPAATSKVTDIDHIRAVAERRDGTEYIEIANNTETAQARRLRRELGIVKHSSNYVSAEGVGMSFEERRRDLARIEAERAGLQFVPEADRVYKDRVRNRIVTATHQVHEMAALLGLDHEDAAVAVGLANRAMARDIRIDTSVRDIILTNRHELATAS